jgi:flavodoxin
MKAIVVYESHWGNTAAIARTICEGIGPGATALPTDKASSAVLAGADLVVAGAPVLGFRLATDGMIDAIRNERGPAPDLTHPSTRS